MSQEIKTCNITINNEKYYDSNVSRAGQAMKNILTIWWSFVQFAWCGGCCCCMALIFAIIASMSTNYIALGTMGFIILICCCCSSYNYYNYSTAKSDLENISNSVKSTVDSRPCKDEQTGQVYN
jgi:hypothetical protein